MRFKCNIFLIDGKNVSTAMFKLGSDTIHWSFKIPTKIIPQFFSG